jgi:Tfp pilus assembly protein FimT
MVVLVCLAVAAAIVFPTASDKSGERLRGAAEILVADLEFAQSESMSHGDDPRLFVIDADRLGYRITKKTTPSVPVTNNVGGAPYVTRFGHDRAAALTNVKVGTYSLGGDDRLGFGALGQLDQTTAATIQLVCGSRKVDVSLDPTTGEITIGPIQ